MQRYLILIVTLLICTFTYSCSFNSIKEPKIEGQLISDNEKNTIVQKYKQFNEDIKASNIILPIHNQGYSFDTKVIIKEDNKESKINVKGLIYDSTFIFERKMKFDVTAEFSTFDYIDSGDETKSTVYFDAEIIYYKGMIYQKLHTKSSGEKGVYEETVYILLEQNTSDIIAREETFITYYTNKCMGYLESDLSKACLVKKGYGIISSTENKLTKLIFSLDNYRINKSLIYKFNQEIINEEQVYSYTFNQTLERKKVKIELPKHEENYEKLSNYDSYWKSIVLEIF